MKTTSKIFICHYSEIGLKGKNRNFFVKGLRKNIRRILKRALPGQVFNIEHTERRFIVFFDEAVSIALVYQNLGDAFGLANFSAVQEVPPTLADMQAETLMLLQDKTFDTFVVRARRIHKSLPFTSMQVNQEIGAAVVEQFAKKVDLHNAQCIVNIEIFKNNAYVSVEKHPGPGGLPVGSSGRVMVLMSGGFDSPIAAYYSMKRGARCEFIHFHSYPFTNRASQEKVRQLVTLLNRYQTHGTLFMVPFTETQQEIVMNVPDKYRIIFYRRFMMRIAEGLARQRGISALVTGESLGQVASQTLENMAAVEQVTTLPILRPLIGMDKNEIMDVARHINSYDISVLPHDDACTRFMPHNPVIRASIDEIIEIEQALDIEELVRRDLSQMEKIEL